MNNFYVRSAVIALVFGALLTTSTYVFSSKGSLMQCGSAPASSLTPSGSDEPIVSYQSSHGLPLKYYKSAVPGSCDLFGPTVDADTSAHVYVAGLLADILIFSSVCFVGLVLVGKKK